MEWDVSFKIDSSLLIYEEKIGDLKSLVNGKTKKAIIELGYSNAMHAQAFETIKGKFVQPGHIVSTQLAKIQILPVIRYNDSSTRIDFIDVITMYLNSSEVWLH